MLTCSIWLLAAAEPAAFWGGIPPDVPTYHVTFTRPSKDDFYAAVKRPDDSWVTDPTELDANRMMQVRLIVDSPWEPVEEKYLLSEIKLQAEGAALRRDRLKRQWQEQGFQFVNTAQGVQPVHQEDVEFARRARAMEKEVRDRLAPPAPAAANPAATPTEEPANASGYWMKEAGVILSGLLLLGLVYYTLLRTSWKAPA